MDEAKWYVVHTYSGYENKVAQNLEKLVENRNMQDVIFDIKVPTHEYERKVFPGYVLIKMIVTDDSWFVVRNIRGVTGFVGPSSNPVPLNDDEVASLGIEKRVIEVGYDVNDNVRIVDGPLEGFEGVVEELDTAKNYVKVKISMFGRETPVELELDQVESLD